MPKAKPEPRLLPCKGGSAVFPSAVSRALPEDVFVVALSTDDLPPGVTEPVFAEYTHCGNDTQAGNAIARYRDMREVCTVLVLRAVERI